MSLGGKHTRTLRGTSHLPPCPTPPTFGDHPWVCLGGVNLADLDEETLEGEILQHVPLSQS